MTAEDEMSAQVGKWPQHLHPSQGTEKGSLAGVDDFSTIKRRMVCMGE